MKFAFKHRMFLVLIFLINHYSAFSQTIKFNKVKATEDEVSGIISGITQDAQGYMWFTTSGSGLARYDGYQVVTYKNDPKNKNSVGSNRLECLLADTNEIFWIGTYGAGLDRFDLSSGDLPIFATILKTPDQ